MRTRLLIPVALSLALAAGTAHAQVVQGGYINGFPAYTLVPPPIPPGFYRTPSPAVIPNPTVRIFPAYGSDYYGTWGYPGFGTFVPGYGYIPGGFYSFTYNNGYVPEYYGSAGPPVNPVVAALGNQASVAPLVGNRSHASARTRKERRALLEAAQRERARETRAAREYKSLLRAKALAPGTLLSTHNNTARVRYRQGGNRRIGEFSTNRVFFSAYTRSGEGNRVATLATDPGLKQAGDRVMVALPRPVTARRSGNRILISNR
jgi:hypothetical protein